MRGRPGMRTTLRKFVTAAAAGVLALGLSVASQGSADAIVNPLPYVSLTSVSSGMCADVFGFNTNNAAQVVQYTCNGLDNQKFTFEDRGTGRFAVKTKFNGKCLEILGLNGGNGTKAVMHDCHYGTNQLWSFEEVTSGVFALRNVGNNRCLDNQGSSEIAVHLYQYECHHGTPQLWK